LGLYLDTTTNLPEPGFTVVAENLPGCMQYLDLVRDCISVFGLATLPPNVVQTSHPLSSGSILEARNSGFVSEDIRLQSGKEPVSRRRVKAKKKSGSGNETSGETHAEPDAFLQNPDMSIVEEAVWAWRARIE
jgi:hypothetical protein